MRSRRVKRVITYYKLLNKQKAQIKNHLEAIVSKDGSKWLLNL